MYTNNKSSSKGSSFRGRSSGFSRSSGSSSGGSKASFGGSRSSFGGSRSSFGSRASSGGSSRASFSGSRGQGGRSGPRGGFGGGGRGRRSSWSPHELIRAVEESNNSNRRESMTSEAVYTPKHKFVDFNINDQIKKNIIAKGFTEPTPIQDQSIPAILDGKDLIGIANTGTGKTAAFLIPLINKVIKDRTQKVLIIAPTRELALQIYHEFRDFSANLKIYSAICIGGANMFRQKDELRKNPNFVIGTPGRIKDFSKHGSIKLSEFNNVVLDETDRMVDIGFITEIKYFIDLLPKVRQSLFFSATISPKVKDILESFVTNPVTVSVKTRETSKNVEQKIIKVESHAKKVEVLHELLIQEGFDKVLIFGRTKWGVQKLSEDLTQRGFKAGAIHGDKRQNQRQHTLGQFKKNEITILLATDVASRGLDIKDVSHVINYDLPESYEDYVHRIGRTGRANKKGIALTFID